MRDELAPLIFQMLDHLEEWQRLRGTALQADVEPAKAEFRKAWEIMKEIKRRILK